MKSFLGLLAVVAVAALWYWQVPVRTLLHLDAQAASTQQQKSGGEAPTPVTVAAVQSAGAAPVQEPAAVPSAAVPTRTLPATPAPSTMSAKQKAELASQVAQAQRAAVAKYPELAVAGSEINSRFVFRYKALLAEQSPRLQDPTWPTQLADECAAASAVKTKTASRR